MNKIVLFLLFLFVLSLGLVSAAVTPETSCSDGIDNEDTPDGDIDCADSYCVNYSACLATVQCVPNILYADCADCIDNDGDGETDTDDIGCLDGTDVSEKAFGYQMELSSGVDSDCLEELHEHSYEEVCLADNLKAFSWYIAYSSPDFFSSCLETYSSEYYDLKYNPSLQYTQIALADCVYEHYTYFSSEIINQKDATPKTVGKLCLNVFYDDYFDLCGQEWDCEDNGDCSSGQRCDTSTKECVSVTCSDSDSDSSDELLEVGVVEGYDDIDDLTSESYSDDCADGDTVTEYSCGSNNLVESENVDCSSGTCTKGACVTSTCLDTDCAAGYVCDTTTNVCYTSCTSNSQCSSDAACVTSETDKLHLCVVCKETDEGTKDNGIYNAGTLTQGVWLTTNAYKENLVDACVSSTEVKEYYCTPYNGHSYAMYWFSKACASGYECKDDACVSSTNTAPTVTISNTSVHAREDLIVIADGSDAEGATLSYTFTLVDNNKDAEVPEVPERDVSGDTFTWDTGVGDEGTYTLTVTVSDGTNTASDSATITVESAITDCADDEDNDGDGDTDYPADEGCTSKEDLSEKYDCNDGYDNDEDGYTDLDDPGCTGTEDKSELYACADGLDNDGDGMRDYDPDGDCYCKEDNYEDNSKSTVTDCEVCNDGKDNDVDGDTDCQDSDCSSDNVCVSGTQCTDGLDNDNDGLYDYLRDDDCKGDASDDQEAECTTNIYCTNNYGKDSSCSSTGDCVQKGSIENGIACSADRECVSEHCGNKKLKCVECEVNSDCSSGTCTKGTCVAETTSGATETDCDDGNDDDGDSYYDCEDSDCSSDGACVCVESDCNSLGYVCDSSSTTSPYCYTGCTSDDQCSSDAACAIDDDYFQGKKGECIVCEDSDGGINYQKKGKIIGVDYFSDSYTSDREDLCNGGSLYEYYCYSKNDHTYNYNSGITIDCSSEYGSGYICSEGACVVSTETSCSDGSDDDSDGDTDCDDSDCSSDSSCVATKCQDSGCTEGYVCDSSSTTSPYCYTGCTSDDQCSSDAACVTSGTNNLNTCVVCQDTDSESVYVKGTVTGVEYTGLIDTSGTDSCTSDGRLIEYSCVDYGVGHKTLYYHTYSCSDYMAGSLCKNGACVKAETSTTLKKSSKTKLGAAEYKEQNIFQKIFSWLFRVPRD